MALFGDKGKELLEAVKAGRVSEVKILLDKGVDPNVMADGMTPLRFAVALGYPAIVEMLVDKGARVNEQYEQGQTVLMKAVTNGKIETTRFLVIRKADVNARDARGWSPLTYASAGGHADTSSYLIYNGAEINIQDNEGFSPLMHAAGKGFDKIVRVLTEREANLHLKNKQGQTVFDIAELKRNKVILDILQEALKAEEEKKKATESQNFLFQDLFDLQNLG